MTGSLFTGYPTVLQCYSPFHGAAFASISFMCFERLSVLKVGGRLKYCMSEQLLLLLRLLSSARHKRVHLLEA